MRLASALLFLALALPARAQNGPHRQSGPRVGITFLSPGVVDRINEASRADGVGDRIDPAFPFVTQFGWQFEFQTFQTESGATGVAEFVPLLSGLERGIVAPSLTFVTGLRTSRGAEFGVGPNVSLSARDVVDTAIERHPTAGGTVRVGLAVVGGVNTRFEGVSLPINAAVVMGAGGARVSLLLGLNTSQSRY